MADEAEKLINLSLCKMAETRTIRRGGTSLHKHLLISTVLTKARSAYFETWYMGDGEITDERTGRYVDLNSSYQELEFPLDDDEDDETNEFELKDPSLSSTSYYEEMPSLALEVTSSSSPPTTTSDDLSAMTNKVNVSDNKLTVTDARYFAGTDNESEIELPSDILSCVEKMGDISDMSFGVDDNVSASSPTNTSANVMVVSPTNVLLETVTHQSAENCSQSNQLVYLDLDSVRYDTSSEHSTSGTTVDDESDESPKLDDDAELIFGSPSHTSTPRPNAPKRRRNWSLEEDEDDERIVHGRQTSSKFSFSHEVRKNDKINGVTKRLRFSPAKEEENETDSSTTSLSIISESYNSPSTTTASITMSNEFRTKKSHFEEDEQEDSDDDTFLGDALLSQNPYDTNPADQVIQRCKNDQRVPSASGGSSSDEDQDGDHGGEAESSMEVDQITNLVQFFSFNKSQTQEQQQQLVVQLSPSSTSVTSTSAVSSSTSTSTSCGPASQLSSSNLVRSMSSPDLCGFVSSQQSSASNAKNIFAYNRNSNNHNNSISHRVLTMKV